MSRLEELHVSRFNRRLISLIETYPRGAMALGLLLVLALGPGILRIQTDFTHTGFFSPDDPKLAKFEVFERRFGNDDTVVIVVESPSGIYDPETLGLVQSLTEKLWHVPEVIRVESVSNYNWLHGGGGEIVVEPFLPATLSPEMIAERRRLAEKDAILPRYLVSPDEKSTLVAGRIKPAIDRPPDSAAITRALRQVVETATVSDETLHIQGTPVVTYAFEEVTLKDISRLVPLVLALVACFLFAILRNAGLALLPFVTVSASMICAFGMAGYAGLVQVPLSTAIPSILIAVGIADTVHILVSYVHALRSSASRPEAARYALTRNLLPTFLTSLTTAVGFFSFMSAPLKPLAMLGMVTGFGTAMTWLFAFVVCGGALFVLPFRIEPRPAAPEPPSGSRARRLTDFVRRRRGAIVILSAALSGFCLWYSIGIEVSTDPIKYFSRDLPVRKAHDALERDMGTSRSIELVVESGREGGALDIGFLRSVDALERELEKDPNVTEIVSIIDTLKQINRTLADDDPAAYTLPGDGDSIAQQMLLYTLALPPGTDLNDRITVREDALRVTLVGNHENSSEAVALVERAIELGRRHGLEIWATGKYFLYQETSDYVVHSLLSSIASASLVIGLIMALMLRSLRLGVVSMIPNIVPLFVAGAVLRLLGRPLDLGTAMVASVALGICIDDTSQILANFARIRREGIAPLPALYRVMEHSLPSLLSTNAVLVASFASFVVATYIPNMLFGLLTAFVFVVALVADLLLTPALLLPLRD
jgi:predicted RND superfamily exporter protein